MIQRHTIKDCWSQEPGKLSKGREEISPVLQMEIWKTRALRICATHCSVTQQYWQGNSVKVQNQCILKVGISPVFLASINISSNKLQVGTLVSFAH